MENKQLWTTVVVALVVAVLASFVTINVAPGLSPRAGGTAPLTVSANSCDADNLCETNSILVNGGSIKGASFIDSTEFFSDTARIDMLDMNSGQISNVENGQFEDFIHVGNELSLVTIDDGSVDAMSWQGNGTGYACLTDTGRLFRSQTPCV